MNPEVVNSETKIIKIKQPWAHAIVKGEKDVENRTWLITPNAGPDTPVWFVVAASKSKPTQGIMRDYQSRLGLDSTTLIDHSPQLPTHEIMRGYQSRLGLDSTRLIDHSQFKFGAMIGVVKLRGCYPSWPSVWYNPGDIAWVIEEAWEFETPIEMDESDKMQTQGSLGADARAKFGYVAKVQNEIAKLV